MSNKIYVGRCTEDMTNDDLQEYFSQFGEVREVFIPKPFRAFAFVTFADPYVAQSLYGDDHVIKNCSVHIGTATPKNAEKYADDGYGWHSKGWAKAGSMHGQGALIDPNTAAAAAAAAVAGFANPNSFNMGFGTGGANAGAFPVNPAIVAAAAQAAIAQGILGMMGQGGMIGQGAGGYPGAAGDNSRYQSIGYSTSSGQTTGSQSGKQVDTSQQVGTYSAYGTYQQPGQLGYSSGSWGKDGQSQTGSWTGT